MTTHHGLLHIASLDQIVLTRKSELGGREAGGRSEVTKLVVLKRLETLSRDDEVNSDHIRTER